MKLKRSLIGESSKGQSRMKTIKNGERETQLSGISYPNYMIS